MRYCRFFFQKNGDIKNQNRENLLFAADEGFILFE